MRSLSRVENFLQSEPDPAFARRARIILENLDLLGKERLLDVGCGRGFYLKVLASVWPELELYGVDSSQDYLSQAQKSLQRGLKSSSVQLIKADATSIPFEDNFFDRVIASEVLEHILDDKRAMREIYRVLKPEGLGIMTVPNKNYPFCLDPLNWCLERLFHTHMPTHIWWLAGIWADHVRLYDKDELMAKLKRSGFKIEKLWQATHYCFPFSHFFLYGVGKNLVERGFCQGFNRFREQSKQSFLNKILLGPLRMVDRFNKKDVGGGSSVNIMAKVRKS